MHFVDTNVLIHPVQPITAQVVNGALALEERFRIHYRDAAILAAARVAGWAVRCTPRT